VMDLEEGSTSMLDDKDSEEWPTAGRIEFQNVHMRYREDLGHVLKGVSLAIEAGHKGLTPPSPHCANDLGSEADGAVIVPTVGVVGRTGAGKSSLINALFRLIELDDGAICIDGRDISTLGLHQVVLEPDRNARPVQTRS
jgi:ATP-binding cassette subfamily C (CFTR/MRP) protein 1